MFRLNSRLGPGGEEPFHSFVPKPFDRHAYECNLYGYRLQPARPRGPGARELRSTDRRLARCIPQAWPGGNFPPKGTSGACAEPEQFPSGASLARSPQSARKTLVNDKAGPVPGDDVWLTFRLADHASG